MYFLDRWRTSVELRLRRPPEFPHREWQDIVEREQDEYEDMSTFDEIFRFSKLCDQESERESLGWRRAHSGEDKVEVVFVRMLLFCFLSFCPKR